MKILVLGGTRFFGIHMVEELLKNGHDVTIATRGNAKDPFGDRVKRIIVERTNPESMKQALGGIHFDTVIDKLAYASNDLKYAMESLDCDRYIQMSSTAVYNPKKLNTKEEDFDGTHEEYEEYLKEEEALAKESSTSENAEEVIISGDDIMEEAADGPEDTLSSLPEFSQTDIDAIMGILKGLKFQVNGETEVLKIIKEEAAAYFAGQKSAEEVSDIIQSRVQVYLKENE